MKNSTWMILMVTAFCFTPSLQAAIRKEDNSIAVVAKNETSEIEKASMAFFSEFSSLNRRAYATLSEFAFLNETEKSNPQALHDRLVEKFDKPLYVIFKYSQLMLNDTKFMAKNNKISLSGKALNKPLIEWKNSDGISKHFQTAQSSIDDFISISEVMKSAVNKTSDEKLLTDVYRNRMTGQLLRILTRLHEMMYVMTRKKLYDSLFGPQISHVGYLNSPINSAARAEEDAAFRAMGEKVQNAFKVAREKFVKEESVLSDQERYVKIREFIETPTELTYDFASLALERSKQNADRYGVVIPNALRYKIYRPFDRTQTIEEQILSVKQIFIDNRKILRKFDGKFSSTTDEFMDIYMEEFTADSLEQAFDFLSLLMEFMDKLYASPNFEFRKSALKKLSTSGLKLE